MTRDDPYIEGRPVICPNCGVQCSTMRAHILSCPGSGEPASRPPPVEGAEERASSGIFTHVQLVGGPADGTRGRISRGHWWDHYWTSNEINEGYGRRLIWRYQTRPDMEHADFVEVIDLGEL